MHVNIINKILRLLIMAAGRKNLRSKKWNSDCNILHKVKVEYLLNSCQEMVMITG